MGNKRNKNLFWYGTLANLKTFLGIVIIFIGVFSSFPPILKIIFIIIGFILIFKGASQKFDYQRKSGYIFHRGD